MTQNEANGTTFDRSRELCRQFAGGKHGDLVSVHSRREQGERIKRKKLKSQFRKVIIININEDHSQLAVILFLSYILLHRI